MRKLGHLLRNLFVIGMIGALSATTASAAGEARRRTAAPPSQPKPVFAADKVEAYLSDDTIAYIRPGLKIKVNSVTIPSDRRPVVDVSFTDDFDQPVDRLGKTTPGAISASFILAWWDPDRRHYTSYSTRSATSPATSPKPNVTAVQAATDSNGTWTDLSTGRATYRFGTTLPANFDQTKTHTLGFQAFRNLTNIPAVGYGRNYYANLEHDFRPDGAAVTDKWAKINDTTSCLACHDKETFGFHGSRARRDVKLCVLCHQPQTTDPDTGHNLDFKMMIHKIHAPGELSAPYVIIGNANSVHDYSGVTFPQDPRECKSCHEGITASGKPAQSDAWYTKPSAEACGSCHDDVNFTTGEKPSTANIKATNAECATCHTPQGTQEFDASIKGAHTIPVYSSQLKGINATITSVTNTAPGQKPTVTFLLKNNDGTFIDGTKLATFSPMIAGSTTDYGKPYYREDGRATGVYNATTGTTTYTFTNAIPADAKGTWTASVDIRRAATLKRANGKADITLQEGAMNPIKHFAVTGTTVTPRRTVVLLSKCYECHDKTTLALHGGQRLNTEECVMCHNPVESDVSRRPAAAGQPESVSFQRMIHRIHTGEELTQEYTVYGFGGNRFNFNEILFPGDRRNCTKCHTGNSHLLPLPASNANVTTLRDYFTVQGPGTAACLGCHDNRDAAAHAYLNTVTFPGTSVPAEACATCHGTGKDWAVDKVHAR